MPNLESKKKYYNSVKRSNFQASLRLQSKESNRMTNLTFEQYLAQLVLLYKNRAQMSGDEARRWIIDTADDVLEAFNEGLSPQEYFESDFNSWEYVSNV